MLDQKSDNILSNQESKLGRRSFLKTSLVAGGAAAALVAGGIAFKATHAAGTSSHATHAAGNSLTPFYRFRSLTTDDHLYITSTNIASDAATLKSRWGYITDSQDGNPAHGIACKVYTRQANGSVPFYRFVNKQKGYHLYITSNNIQSDTKLAEEKWGYSLEGIACYIFDSNHQAPGTVPLYRLVKPDGAHFWAASTAERDNAIAHYGFQPEQGYTADTCIAGFVFPANYQG